MFKRTAALVVAVVVASAAIAGGAGAHSAPAQASAVAVQATAEPVPAANAQPGQAQRPLHQLIPFYWRTFRNWDGSLCVGLYSDNGQATPIYYCY